MLRIKKIVAILIVDFQVGNVHGVGDFGLLGEHFEKVRNGAWYDTSVAVLFRTASYGERFATASLDEIVSIS